MGIAVCTAGELLFLGANTLSSLVAPPPTLHPPGSNGLPTPSPPARKGGGASGPHLCAVLGNLLFLVLSVLASLSFIAWGYGIQYALFYTTLEPYQFQSYFNAASSGAPPSLMAILNQYQVINTDNFVNVVKYGLLVSMGCLFLALVTVRMLTRASDDQEGGGSEEDRKRTERSSAGSLDGGEGGGVVGVSREKPPPSMTATKIHVEAAPPSQSQSQSQSQSSPNKALVSGAANNNQSTGGPAAHGQGLSVHAFFFVLRALPLALYLFSVGVLVLLLLRLLYRWGPDQPLNAAAFDDYNEEAQGGVGQRDDALPW